MQSRRLILLIVFLLILVLTVYNQVRNRYSTLGAEMKNLALPDVGKITGIILKNPSSRPDSSLELHLVKRDLEWFVNDSVPAKPGLVESFLQAMASVTVKAPLPDAKARMLKKSMEKEGTQVVFLAGKHIIRHYFIFSHGEGPFILQKGYGKPVSFAIPGFTGDPSGIFTVQPAFWEDVALHPLPSGEMKEVKLQYTEKPGLSFCLRKTGPSDWSLIDSQGKVQQVSGNSLALKDFVISLRRIPGVVPKDSSQTTAIAFSLNKNPFAVLTTLGTSDSITISFYRYLSGIPAAVRPDPYICIARSSRSRYILLVKYMDLDNLLTEPSDFMQ
ncbi:MAG TPA: hypothetical protein PK825_08560 [Bacteroidales bacterium]|nr:hypothetical protein [Bacteroidales bacterium]